MLEDNYKKGEQSDNIENKIKQIKTMAEIFVMSFLFIITFAVLSTGIFQRDFAFLQLEEREHCFTEATILKKKKHSADNTANSKQRCSYLPSVKGDDLLELKEKLNNFRFPPVSAQITAT